MSRLSMLVILTIALFSIVGVALSVTIHIGSLIYLPWPLELAGWLLPWPTLVVCFGAAFCGQRIALPGVRGKSLTKILAYCPSWMRWFTYGCAVYALANLGMLIVQLFVSRDLYLDRDEQARLILRELSAYCMCFNEGAGAIVYVALRQRVAS